MGSIFGLYFLSAKQKRPRVLGPRHQSKRSPAFLLLFLFYERPLLGSNGGACVCWRMTGRLCLLLTCLEECDWRSDSQVRTCVYTRNALSHEITTKAHDLRRVYRFRARNRAKIRYKWQFSVSSFPSRYTKDPHCIARVIM